MLVGQKLSSTCFQTRPQSGVIPHWECRDAVQHDSYKANGFVNDVGNTVDYGLFP